MLCQICYNTNRIGLYSMEFKIFKKRKPTKREICPLCNKGYKEERYNSRNELVFYGCTNFPECKYKEKIKTNTKYYIDILIDGYESIFTYKCNKNFILMFIFTIDICS